MHDAPSLVYLHPQPAADLAVAVVLDPGGAVNWERTDFDRLEAEEGWVLQTFRLPRGERTHVRYRGVLQIIAPCESEGVAYAERYAVTKRAA